MANEPLKGVAPQPKPVAQPTVSVETPAVTPVTPEVTPAPVVEPTRERTQENFEKLLENNAKLYQQNQANNATIQQLLSQQKSAQPAIPTVDPGKLDITDFISKDPVSGEEFIDRAKMQQTLTAIQQQAIQARDMAQQTRVISQQQEKDRQEREAYSVYPDLNPISQSFDSAFNRATRAFLTDSMLNQNDYGGRALSFKEAADLVRAGAKPTQAQVAVAEKVEAEQTAQPQAGSVAPTANQKNKEQASASVANQPPQAASEISEEELKMAQLRTRMGDDNALAERLMHTDHIFGPNSGSGQPEK